MAPLKLLDVVVGFKLFKVSLGSSVFRTKDEHMTLTLWGSDIMAVADSYVTECNLSGWWERIHSVTCNGKLLSWCLWNRQVFKRAGLCFRVWADCWLKLITMAYVFIYLNKFWINLTFSPICLKKRWWGFFPPLLFPPSSLILFTPPTKSAVRTFDPSKRH